MYSSEEIKELILLLEKKDCFKSKWGYDPFDNYVWREILSFDYLKKFYPTIERMIGRYGADGFCPELGLTHIEDKSTKITKRKKTNDYSIEKSRYQFDLSKSFDKVLLADGFSFSLFDTYNSTYPIHILFIHKKDNVQIVKDLIIEKKKEWDKKWAGTNRHAHIDLVYSEIEHLGEKYGEFMPSNNIMEFMK